MKCPICGEENTLSVCFLKQYSHNYKITKKGILSKKYTVEDAGSIEVSVLVCKNGCNVNDLDWELDRFTDKLIIHDTKRWYVR